MIIRSQAASTKSLLLSDDVFIYGLGFETRSTTIARRAAKADVLALRMPALDIHNYMVNIDCARELSHNIVDEPLNSIDDKLRNIIQNEWSDRPLRIGFDISSVNRPLLFATLFSIAGACRPSDEVTVYYSPAAFQQPDWQFPQIERLGPISPELSAYNNDPGRPLCLVIGLGFEPGVSMGIISQLEPSAAFCFWGTGLDERFDDAVRRANFEFEYTGFETRTVPYLIQDPLGAYSQLESLIYGLIPQFNVVFAPMGPKIFALHTALLALRYPGYVAVWRVQQRREVPPDATPGEITVVCQLDVAALRRGSALRDEVLTA